MNEPIHSFDGTTCRCGERKLSQTLICAQCESAFEGHPDFKTYSDETYTKNARRSSAILLLAMAKRRKHVKKTIFAD